MSQIEILSFWNLKYYFKFGVANPTFFEKINLKLLVLGRNAYIFPCASTESN